MQFFDLRKGEPFWAIPGQRTHVNCGAPVFSVGPRRLRGFGFFAFGFHNKKIPVENKRFALKFSSFLGPLVLLSRLASTQKINAANNLFAPSDATFFT